MTTTQLILYFYLCGVLAAIGIIVTANSVGGIHNTIFYIIKLPLQIIGAFIAWAGFGGIHTYTISWKQGDKEYKINIG